MRPSWSLEPHGKLKHNRILSKVSTLVSSLPSSDETIALPFDADYSTIGNSKLSLRLLSVLSFSGRLRREYSSSKRTLFHLFFVIVVSSAGDFMVTSVTLITSYLSFFWIVYWTLAFFVFVQHWEKCHSFYKKTSTEEIFLPRHCKEKKWKTNQEEDTKWERRLRNWHGREKGEEEQEHERLRIEAQERTSFRDSDWWDYLGRVSKRREKKKASEAGQREWDKKIQLISP